jgi:UDPglucose--hexose-1-phosphate uridylyltransferase
MRSDGQWKIRWFPNKFNFVDKLGNPKIKTDNEFFTFSDAYGKHEVLVETPDHSKQMTDLTVEELADVLKVYASRVDELMNEPNIKFVSIFKNSGPDAGTSIEHSHSQIVSLAIIPPVVAHKLEAVKKYPSCPYCRILNIEKTSFRHCFENESFVAFTPYASRFNYEIWVFPKNHYRFFMDISDDGIMDLARIMKQILLKLADLGAAFNIAFYYSPKGEDLHFHIEFEPRIAKWAGLELENEIFVNQVSPEDAAKFYRGDK